MPCDARLKLWTLTSCSCKLLAPWLTVRRNLPEELGAEALEFWLLLQEALATGVQMCRQS